MDPSSEGHISPLILLNSAAISPASLKFFLVFLCALCLFDAISQILLEAPTGSAPVEQCSLSPMSSIYFGRKLATSRLRVDFFRRIYIFHELMQIIERNIVDLMSLMIAFQWKDAELKFCQYGKYLAKIETNS